VRYPTHGLSSFPQHTRKFHRQHNRESVELAFVLSQVSESRPFDFAQGRLSTPRTWTRSRGPRLSTPRTWTHSRGPRLSTPRTWTHSRGPPALGHPILLVDRLFRLLLSAGFWRRRRCAPSAFRASSLRFFWGLEPVSLAARASRFTSRDFRMTLRYMKPKLR